MLSLRTNITSPPLRSRSQASALRGMVQVLGACIRSLVLLVVFDGLNIRVPLFSVPPIFLSGTCSWFGSRVKVPPTMIST